MDISKEINEKTKQIDEIKKEIEELKQKKKEFEKREPEASLAELFHKLFCKQNHTDGCGWFYESWDNPGHAKNRYLKFVKSFMEKGNFSHEETAKIIHNLIEAHKEHTI